MDDDDSSPRILISDRQSLPVDAAALAEAARKCLIAEGEERAELSVSLVDEDEMADLHVRYMDEEGPTDVLSFPLGEGDEDGVHLLGDVVICPAFAVRNNPDLNRDLAAELRLLLVHGTLHLLGYDHEKEDERRAMWERQEAYTGVRVP
jgi:probable rRNA maturation factor